MDERTITGVISFLKSCTLILLIYLLASCKYESATEDSYSTWQSRGSVVYETTVPPPQELPEDGSFIWGGTVSHHLLAHSYIDLWFKELKKKREPEIFFILSPSHFNTRTQRIALTTKPWASDKGLVTVEKKIVKKIMKSLGVKEDQQAFTGEHGVAVFAPLIKEYFPRAKMVPLIYTGESPCRIAYMKDIYSAVSKEYLKDYKKSFILVSVDFSHHGDTITTAVRDKTSKKFFKNPKNNGWFFAGCDNRPGMYFISNLFSKWPESSVSLLWHSTSEKILKQKSEDITSYFFSFFYSPNLNR